jgi:AraC-like DNA-binding protein
MDEPGLTFLAGQSLPRCTHRIDKHFRDYCTLQHMDGGKVSLKLDEVAYALNGRAFWSAWPGPRVRFRPSDEHGTWRHRYIAFRGPLVSRWMDEGLFPVLPQPAPRRDAAARFDALLELARQPRKWSQRRAINLLESLLLELAEARDQPTAPVALERVKRQLVESREPGSYAELAEQLGWSERSLRRNFRSRYGTSPHQYVIESRVERAKRLLLESDLPIKEIARQLGYGDVFYFGRQFRRHAGVPPATYRRSREG